MLKLRTLDSLNIQEGDRVFVAIDADVPLNSQSEIEDNYRLRVISPTINELLQKGAIITLGGHLGRPEGKINQALSLKPVKNALNEILKQDVVFLENPLSPVSRSMVGNASAGTVFLLENLRFYSGEEEGDRDFAKELSFYGQYYVNENFSTCHRKDVSLAILPTLITGVAGRRLMEEIETLLDFKKSAPRPVVAVIGGAKVKDKGPAVTQLSRWCDFVLVGGKVGFDLEEKDIAKNVILPEDGVEGKDIGPGTISKYVEYVRQAQSILWAGPLGIMEEKAYQKGTRTLANEVVQKVSNILIGGGDTLKTFKQLKLMHKVSWASVGGGAMLSLLADEPLPALAPLRET